MDGGEARRAKQRIERLKDVEHPFYIQDTTVSSFMAVTRPDQRCSLYCSADGCSGGGCCREKKETLSQAQLRSCTDLEKKEEKKMYLGFDPQISSIKRPGLYF